MHRDFSEMLSALSDAGAEFLIVGAHALGANGHPRATRDLDIWVNATPENARRVWRALADYGAPLHDLTEQELATPGISFQIGVAPFRIDIMTDISGVAFAEAWPDRITVELGGRRVPVIGRAQFIATIISAPQAVHVTSPTLRTWKAVEDHSHTATVTRI